ncbi:hypothetical protein EWF20_04920 [Sulfolobus sp. S-194]|uniref:hypothetical protein n=1 Tax=Sulfolobus sp. S-194 TaxID=2512240 RepID=UPI001436F769|nr:hypothetical protein [Sulfolobus sp. S-194]QIW23562.1 hypothetical protein EWF20_04920 [Sulfolobus sp. S-194]
MSIVKLAFLAIVIIILGIVVSYSLYDYFTSPYYKMIEINTFSKIYSLIVINSNEVVLGGVKIINNTFPIGIAGIYFLNNNTFINFNVSEYFNDGYIYSLGYNGTAILLGGSTRINGTLHTSLVEINLQNYKIYNLSNFISPFYTIGQIYAIDWIGSYWLVGGNAYIVGVGQSPFLIPFLLKINSSGFYDLSPKLPSDFKVLGGSSTIYSIYSTNSSSIIVGGNAVNMTVTIYHNNTFYNISFNFLHLGVLLTSYYWKGYWLIGGENLTNPENPEPFLAYINNSQVYPIRLKYQLGVVTSISSINNNIIIALRIPFIISNGTTYGSVILYGNNFKNLNMIISKPFIVIEDMVAYNNILYGVGYVQKGNYFYGMLLILSRI